MEARTKELAGIAKRRETLQAEHAEAEAEATKIEGLHQQVTAALEDVNRLEAQAIDEFQQQGGALKKSEADLIAKRDACLADVDADLVSEYRKTAERLGSIAIGTLDDDRCGRCPSCQRLLIIKL